MAGLTLANIRAGIDCMAPRMQACAGELNTADGKLGDGDIGITMARGMAALSAISDELPEDVGMAFFVCSKEFTKVSGSSYGTLLATGLMAAAKACKGRETVDWAEVSDLFASALAAMIARGKGALGDKTVLDTVEAMRIATAGLNRPDDILVACDGAVAATMDEFRDRVSKLGRARMYGDKSRGLDDPGMLALRRMIDGLKRPA